MVIGAARTAEHEREETHAATPWGFLCHLLSHIPITPRPQIKIWLQETLSKLLSINFTTVSEWLRFFYSHDW